MTIERRLEDAVIEDPEILGLDLLIIKRQHRTDLNRPLDLLAIDQEARLHVVELKRDRTPRDVVAQTLEYGSWVAEQTFDDVAEIYEREHGQRLEQAFAEKFDQPLEGVHEDHQLLIVASELDPTTERICRYLADVVGAPIDVALFRCFEDDGRVYLARTWLADGVSEDVASPSRRGRSSSKSADDAWNGRDYVVTISNNRTWEDARRYGVLGAGGGQSWIGPLKKIPVGATVFPYVAKNNPEDGHGYVGVGRVLEAAQPIDSAYIGTGDSRKPVLEVIGEMGSGVAPKGVSENTEHVLIVQWLDTVPLEDALFATGMRPIPSAAYRLKHRFTRDKLYERFSLDAED